MTCANAETSVWSAAEALERKDADTGRKVLQLTRHPSINSHTYYHNTPFHPRMKGLLVKSNRSGNDEYYQMEWGTWRFRQISKAVGAQLSFPIWSVDGACVRFFEGLQLVEIDWDSGERKVIYQSPPGEIGHSLSTDLKSRVMFHIRMLPEKLGEFRKLKSDHEAKHGKTTYGAAKERVLLRPPCEVIRQDWKTLQAEVIIREDDWLTHSLAHPHDVDLVCYSRGAASLREGGAAKSWLIRRGESSPRPVTHPYGEKWRTCHQFFADNGDLIYDLTSAQYERRPAFICVRKGPDYTQAIKYAMPDRCSHYHVRTRDNLFVGDGRWGKEHSSLQDFIYRITIDEKESVAWPEPWVRHYAKGQGQETHPHPTFSPDGKFVVFNSCLDGKPDVCLVEI